MIFARLSNGHYLIGIDAENVRRLTAGDPLVVDLRKLGGSDVVSFVYGETLQDIVRDLEEATGSKLPPASPVPPRTTQ